MLRLCQRAHAHLNRALAGSSVIREYATPAWPTDISIPDGMKPFDPRGSLGQVDKYTQGLPEDDALVQFVRKLRDLRLAVDKLAAEKKAVRVPVLQGPSWLVSNPHNATSQAASCTYRQAQICLVA